MDKSGQCDLRKDELKLEPTNLEILYSAALDKPPELSLTDVAENESFDITASSFAS